VLFWPGEKGEELLCLRVLANATLGSQGAAVADAAGQRGLEVAQSPWLGWQRHGSGAREGSLWV